MSQQPHEHSQVKNPALTPSRRATLASIARMVEPLNQTLIGPSEVVLHDLSRLPNSIVAIAGNLTGRQVGAPATDAMLQSWYTGEYRTNVSYETSLPDGRPLRSTTVVIADDEGPFGALCLNMDVSIWQGINEVTAAILPGGQWPGLPARQVEVPPEDFVHNIDELAGHLLTRAVAATGIPVDLMRKEHKLKVIADLKSRGFFLLKDSIETAAASLGVTRFTVYNYLNELESDAKAPQTTKKGEPA